MTLEMCLLNLFILSNVYLNTKQRHFGTFIVIIDITGKY